MNYRRYGQALKYAAKPKAAEAPVVHGEEYGFHHAISENPADRTLHLVYADWLEENGKPGVAAMIRHAVQEHARRVTLDLRDYAEAGGDTGLVEHDDGTLHEQGPYTEPPVASFHPHYGDDFIHAATPSAAGVARNDRDDLVSMRIPSAIHPDRCLHYMAWLPRSVTQQTVEQLRQDGVPFRGVDFDQQPTNRHYRENFKAIQFYDDQQ